MKKVRIIYLVMSISALCAELFGKGAICVFAVSPEKTQTTLFSYFSLVPFGYANFGPFITAVLTAVIVLLSVVLFTKKAHKITRCLKVLNIAAFTASLLPLIMLGAAYFNLVSYIITVILAAMAVMTVFVKKEVIKNEA